MGTEDQRDLRRRLPEHGGTVLDRFELVVQAMADRVAIVERGVSWSYEELAARSTAIAAVLREHLRGDEAPVLLLFERAAPAIAAMLGCAMVGAPYVPLHPSDPPRRTEHIANNSGASFALAGADGGSSARALQELGLTVLDADNSGHGAIDLAGEQVPADSPLWILYTSGSTGEPKGVVQTHENLLHFVDTYTAGLDLTADDRFALLYSYTANAANHEIFSALLNGATVYPFNARKEGLSTLGAWLEEHGITVYSSVPTVFRHLHEAMPGGEILGHVRIVKLVGEPVYRRDYEIYLQRCSDSCRFVNRYGSTETGTVCWFFADKVTHFDGVNVPIGAPTRDHRVVIVGEGGEPVCAGESGEIVVRSPYLSPGYWRRPDLSEKAFGRDAEGRFYRTGDVGTQVSDDCFVHMGRKDFQVKLRGFRIETAEIEAALIGHPDIRDALVQIWEDAEDDRRLVAYYVGEASGKQPSVSELRRHLSERLAEHMIPNAFVRLGAFPLAPNGKIQRSALPPPGTKRPDLDSPFAEPTTPVEKRLAQIWCRILRIERVGLGDNFFELGGHSLALARVLMAVEEASGVVIPIERFLADPAIASLASAVEDGELRDAATLHPGLVPIRPTGGQPPFFCLAEVNLLNSLAEALPEDWPLYGLRIPGLRPGETALETIREMAEYCCEAIERIDETGPYLLGGLCFGGMVAYEMARRLQERGREVALLVLLDAVAGADRRRKRLRFFHHRLLHNIRNRRVWVALRNRALQTRGWVARLADGSWRRVHRLDSAKQRARKGFRPEAISVPILFVYPSDDPAPPSAYREELDPRSVWRRVATGDYEEVVVPGGHTTIFLEEGKHLLARHLARAFRVHSRAGQAPANDATDW